MVNFFGHEGNRTAGTSFVTNLVRQLEDPAVAGYRKTKIPLSRSEVMIQFHYSLHLNKEADVAEKTVVTTIKVSWPIPVTTELTVALYNIMEIIRGQHPESEINIFSIFVGNPELKGLVFEDVHKHIYLNCFSDPNPVPKGYMEITFSVKPK